jgi:RNA polymerase sigma-70 factor (ECF subfamily)
MFAGLKIKTPLEQAQIQQMPDNELVEAFKRSRDTVYFDQLYRKYASKVYGKCLSFFKDPVRAEDAVQDIFIKVLMKIRSFRGNSKFSTWLYSVTYNYCIDRLRKNRRDPLVFPEDMPWDAASDDDIHEKELLEIEIDRLKTVLEDINVLDKAILLMKYQDSMSITEIGEIIEKKDSAVKMQLKRARHKFMRAYRRRYDKKAYE